MPVADGKRIPFRKQRRFWEKHQETGQLVMMLQEDCFTEYFRVYCLGGKAVRIMQYEREMNLTYVTLLMDLQ
jgi:hypothetical protein